MKKIFLAIAILISFNSIGQDYGFSGMNLRLKDTSIVYITQNYSSGVPYQGVSNFRKFRPVVREAISVVTDTTGLTFALFNPSDKNVRYMSIQTILSYASGASQWTTTGSDIYYNTGGVGIGATSVNSVSILELTSTTKGFRLPRMTSTQRTTITAVAGLLVFDTDSASAFQYTGSAWQNLYNSGGGGGGSQTPWTSNIDGAGFNLSNVGDLDVDGNSVFNDAGAVKDFRIEGDTDPNLFFTKGSNNTIGIGASSPQAKLHLKTLDPAYKGIRIETAASQTANAFEVYDGATVLTNINAQGLVTARATSNQPNTLAVLEGTGANAVTFGTYPGFATIGGMWAGNITPSTTNYAFIGDGTTYSIFNGATRLYFRIGHSVDVMHATTTGVGIFNTSPSLPLDVVGAATVSTTINAGTGFRIANAAASRKMLVGNGTNFVASTETWAVPGTSGNVLTSDGTNWTSAAPAGGTTPTFQQVLTAGSTLTGSNTISWGSSTLVMPASTGSFGVNSSDGAGRTINIQADQTTGAATLKALVSGDAISQIDVFKDSLKIYPHLGQINIDTLRTWSTIGDTAYKKGVTWDSRNGRLEVGPSFSTLQGTDTTRIVTGPTGFYQSAYSPRSTFMYEKAIKISLGGVAVAATPTDSTAAWDLSTESTYTPTLTNTTNIAASTAYTTYYVRIGDWVHVWGTVDIDATAGVTISEMGMSTPTTTDITQIYELSGTASFEDNTSVQIKGDVTNNRAMWRFTPQSASNNKYSFHFSYKHITP